MEIRVLMEKKGKKGRHVHLWFIKYFCSRATNLNVSQWLNILQQKLGDIRGYHPSDIPHFSNHTSTEISLNSRWENGFWLLQKKGNILFMKSHQRTPKSKHFKSHKVSCSYIFFRARCKIIEGQLSQESLFCAKIWLYICPWTLSVPWSSKFILELRSRKTVCILIGAD